MPGLLDNKASASSAIVSRSHVLEDLAVVVAKEAATLSFLASRLPTSAVDLVEAFLGVPGKVVFTGIGKSGLIAQKSAATFSSLGIPSIFLHPHDALHGDLGVIRPGDFVCFFSKSGSGEEFEFIFAIARMRGVKTALICCSRGKVARLADIVLEIPCSSEACALGLAPTSSTTAMLTLSDALAVVVSSRRGFTRNDFAQNHPAGVLGKRLLLTVEQIMHKEEELPLVGVDAPFKEIIVVVTSKKLGCAVVIDDNKRLLGVITDGDVRRVCERGAEVFLLTAEVLMSATPKTVSSQTLASVALALMESFAITSLVVIEHEQVVGIVHIHDIIKAGIKGE